MAELVLYTYWRSSASNRVRIALGYKNLAYRAVHVNLLTSEQRGESYRNTNPMGQLPSLVVDGVTYVESTAILELLEELHPDPPLLPKAPADRARVRALVQIVNSGIQPMQNLAVLDQLGDDKEKRAAWIRHFIARGFDAWEKLAVSFAEQAGHSGPFAYGSAFTAADAVLIPQIYGARRHGVSLDPYPTIRRVDEATRTLPFVAAAHPDVQPDAKP